VQRILRNPLLTFGAWWLLWTLIGSWPLHGYGFSWTLSIVDAGVTQLDWTLAGYVVNLILQYYRPSSKSIINVIFLSLALAALFTFVALPWLLPLVVPQEPGYIEFLNASLPVRFLFAWMQLLFVATFSWLWYFVLEQQEHKKREADADKLVKEAELAQLRQQLQPHFLFNSLNSINALVGTQPEQARKMVQQLSDFLRGTVKKDDRQRVTLEDELSHLQLYLDIEKVRFGYRLNSLTEADEKAKAMKLPPMLLQPIVENAIKFGLYDTIGEITISLNAYTEQNNLVIEVKNPFDPATSQPRQGTGFGLNSIARRLYLIYSQNDLLQTSVEGSVFTTQIKIPQV
jgi:two-component system, LytTR family, sensor kinase